jgi:Sulfite exporter TauE/SafE
MNILEFSSLLFGTSIFAGLLGALTGLGGGVVIVPALVLLLKVDIRYAIGASLVSVIATSSGAAVAYVREGLPNIRIGNVSRSCDNGRYPLRRISHHQTLQPLDRDRLLASSFFIPPMRRSPKSQKAHLLLIQAHSPRN